MPADTGPRGSAVRRAVRDEVSDLAPDALVLVACSGGADSLSLAHATRAVRDRAGAVVVDHGLQTGSAEVAARTAAWLRASGLDPVDVVQVTVVEAGDGPEAAARDARYRALFRFARDHGAEAVLLGHTLDDQAETVLLGLARGSGTRSLAGMPRSRGPFRFARVRVRHRVLPVLEAELGPGIAEALARTADLARADADALAELADEVAWDVIHGARDEGTLDVVDLEPLSDAVRSRVVRQWLLDGGCPAGRLGADHVQRVCRLVTHWTGQGAVALPGGVEAVRDYGRLALRQTPLPRKET